MGCELVSLVVLVDCSQVVSELQEGWSGVAAKRSMKSKRGRGERRCGDRQRQRRSKATGKNRRGAPKENRPTAVASSPARVHGSSFLSEVSPA
jgi:hypothetical protein